MLHSVAKHEVKNWIHIHNLIEPHHPDILERLKYSGNMGHWQHIGTWGTVPTRTRGVQRLCPGSHGAQCLYPHAWSVIFVESRIYGEVSHVDWNLGLPLRLNCTIATCIVMSFRVSALKVPYQKLGTISAFCKWEQFCHYDSRHLSKLGISRHGGSPH